MSAYRSLNRLVLAKIESTSGTDASPSVGSNAVLVAKPQSTPNLNNIEPEEVTGALDDRASIPASGNRSVQATVYCKGPGSGVGTTAPEVDPLLKACGLGRTDLAADVTGTAQAGASGSITLAAGASSTTDLYKGFVIVTTSGTGSGQTRIVTAYNGTTKVASVTPAWTTTPDNTTVYAIRKGSLYRPTSASLPTVTLYEYLKRSDGGNSKLKKTVGAAGNARFVLQVSQGCYFEFQMTGSLVADSDVSDPGSGTYQSNRPIPFQAASVYLGDTAIKLRDFTLDLGNQVQQVEDPSATLGLGIASITRRRIGGSFQAPMELQSVRDTITSWQQGTQYALSAVWGSTLGNRFAMLLDTLVFTGQSDTDVSGFGYEQLPFRTNAADGGFSFLYW